MPNEFKIRNGFLSTGNSQITGSLNVTGGVTGSFSGNGAGLTGVAAFPFTGSALITGSLGVTGSASILAFTGSSATIFNVRNAANTYNLLSIDGTGYFSIANSTNGQTRFWVGTDPTYPTFNLGNSISADGFKTYVSAPNGSVQIEANGNGLNLSSGYGIYSTATIHQLYTSTTLRMHTDATGTVFGNSTSPGARLDVRAQGALSTDIAFRVRNSADTADTFSIRGNDDIYLPLAPFNSSKTIYTGTDALIRYSPIAIGTIALGQGATFTNATYYNTIIGSNASTGATVGFGIAIGWSATITGNQAIGIGDRARAAGTNSIRIGNSDGGASTYGGTNSIHLGKTVSGNNITADNVFMTYFDSQAPSILARNNGSFGLLGQQAYILGNGTGIYGTDTFMGNGGNTLVVATHPSPPSSSVTTAFQLYASTGSLSGNVRPHFRTSNGTIVWLGDESRLFNVTASNITASNITAASLTIPSGSITLTTGSITMPNRPAFRVTGAGGGKVAVTTLSGSYLNVDYQQGGGWDNSTGTFTAPIEGLYQVNLVTRTNSNSLGTISQLIVYKNNTGGVTGTPQIMIEFGSNTTMNHTGGSTISKLAVGDTLKMVVAVGEISFDANDNFSVAYIG